MDKVELRELVDELDDEINQYLDDVENGMEEDYGYFQDLLSDIEYYQEKLEELS